MGLLARIATTALAVVDEVLYARRARRAQETADIKRLEQEMQSLGRVTEGIMRKLDVDLAKLNGGK